MPPYHFQKPDYGGGSATQSLPARPGVDRESMIEAICQARCQIPNVHWADGLTEGVERIERMIAEKQLDAIMALLGGD
jgi:hypothetical protein